jgi:hypothetical protein
MLEGNYPCIHTMIYPAELGWNTTEPHPQSHRGTQPAALDFYYVVHRTVLEQSFGNHNL